MQNSEEQNFEPPAARNCPTDSKFKANVSFREMAEHHFGVKMPQTTKLLIWSMGIISVIGLTIYGFIPLIMEYRDNNVVTKVDVILLDHHFIPPQMVLYLPRAKIINKYGNDLMILAASLYANKGTCGPEALEICENLKSASLDVWNGRIQDFNQTSLETFYRSLTLAFIDKIFMNPNPLELFDDNQNEVAISSLWNFIGWMTSVDIHLTPTPKERGFDLNLYPAVDLGQKFENFDHKFELLHKRMLEILCTRMKYTEFDYLDEFSDPVPNYKTCYDVAVNSINPIYIGMGLLFALPEVETPIIKEYRIKIINPSRPYENSSLLTTVGIDPYKGMTIYADAGSLYGTILDQAYAPRLFQTPSETRKVGQKITVKHKVQMRARETRSNKISCSKRTSTTTCFMQCTKLWIIEECKCVPFSWKKALQYDKKMSNCNPFSYTKCYVTVLPKSIRCIEKCKRPCDYTIYSFQISYDTFILQNDSVHEFSVRMVPLFDSFAEFTWIVKDSPEQFFSQLAGVGSFYLGFSGLSVVSVIIWCMDMWKNYKKRKADKSENTRKAEEGKDDGTCMRPFPDKFTSDNDQYCGTTCEKRLLELEARLEAKLRDDIEIIIERKHAIKQNFSVFNNEIASCD